MKFSRDGWLAIGVILVLVIVTIGAAIGQTPTIPYLSSSSSADGTLALKLWLEASGYQIPDEALSTYQPPQNADLVFILQPVIEISDAEWKTLDQWVANGGTLILAGDNLQTEHAFGHYGFLLTSLDQETSTLSVQTPLLTSPPLTSPISIHANLALGTSRSDVVIHLAAQGQPILVSFDQGQGRVILSSTPYPFSNIALKDKTTASLVLNLIGLSIRHGIVWFDEWHHGIQQSTEIIGPDQWLRLTSLGHALLFIVAAVFWALLLQGRAFGRPVPLPHEIKRRGPMEHVTAIANLDRKAGHRGDVMEHYHSHLKSHLARRYSLDPSLLDKDYVRALAQYSPSLDQIALLNLLKGLSQKNIGEAEMIKLAVQASEWMKDNVIA